MRTELIQAALILGLASFSQAEAGPILYTTTDLGSGIQYQTNSDGQIYGVSNLNGGVVYAFDKSPVTSLNISSVPNRLYDGGYELLTMQSGSHQAGYIFNQVNPLGFTYYPTFESPGNGWYNSYSSPISDVNLQGQVVGTSQSLNSSQTYAAFSGMNEQSHGYDASLVDNLNSYIAPIPGVSLTMSFRIDDLGRIIALGSNDEDYLLTPTSLGTPAIVPEPPALLMTGMIMSWLGLRLLSRRSKA